MMNLPEVYESRNFVDVVDFRRLWIVIFHEIDSERVGLVVNQLQNLENGFTLNAVLVV